MMPDSALPAHVAADLERSGYCVIEGFLDANAIAALAFECRSMHEREELRPAAIGRARGHHVDASIRGDHTRWFDEARLTPAQSIYWTSMDFLRTSLNRQLLLGLDEIEAHYALYPPGARYARHRDRFRDDDARVLSSVLYLNRAWRKADGGALRIYVSEAAGTSERESQLDIAPRAGTLVLFLSADFDHEVLAASRERMSVAGWFRRSR
jgi:SM-20-related protein